MDLEQLQRQIEVLKETDQAKLAILRDVAEALGLDWADGSAVEVLAEAAERMRLERDGARRGCGQSLTNGWHRRAQLADHWRAKYERQAAHAKRVEQELAELRRQLDAEEQPTVEKLLARMAELIADRDAARRERDEAKQMWRG